METVLDVPEAAVEYVIDKARREVQARLGTNVPPSQVWIEDLEPETSATIPAERAPNAVRRILAWYEEWRALQSRNPKGRK